MRRFLELYQESRSPTFLAPDFRRAIGSEAVDALLASAVLTPRELADWYPCQGAYPGCPRRIVPNIGDSLHPFVAVCGEVSPMCHEIAVRAEDLEEYTTSHEAFARTVGRLLGLGGELVFLDDSYPDCVYLGDLGRGERTYDVFLCRAAWDSAFEALLSDRVAAARRSIVFAPTPRGLPIDLLHRYASGGHVTLALLVDFVGLHDGKLILRPSFEELIADRHATPHVEWTLVTHEGRRSIGAPEYAKFVENAEQFDLFLDAVAPGHSRAYAAGYRNEDGKYHRVNLSALQMLALTELVSRGVPIRASELRSLQMAGVHNPAKIIDAARRAVASNSRDTAGAVSTLWQANPLSRSATCSGRRLPSGTRVSSLAAPEQASQGAFVMKNWNAASCQEYARPRGVKCPGVRSSDTAPRHARRRVDYGLGRRPPPARS